MSKYPAAPHLGLNNLKYKFPSDFHPARTADNFEEQREALYLQPFVSARERRMQIEFGASPGIHPFNFYLRVMHADNLAKSISARIVEEKGESFPPTHSRKWAACFFLTSATRVILGERHFNYLIHEREAPAAAARRRAAN